MNGKVTRGTPRRTYIDLIGEVLQKDQVRSTRNHMIRCMNVDEARGVTVCKDRSRWCSVVCAYPHGKESEFMYV